MGEYETILTASSLYRTVSHQPLATQYMILTASIVLKIVESQILEKEPLSTPHLQHSVTRPSTHARLGITICWENLYVYVAVMGSGQDQHPYV